jgi:D-serine deaminase-like pyridoxal phosphate-dependent protein
MHRAPYCEVCPVESSPYLPNPRATTRPKRRRPNSVGREDIHIERLSEEHGWLRLDPAGSNVETRETLEIVPVHACPVANLADELTVVRDDAVIERWAVAAAGRVR